MNGYVLDTVQYLETTIQLHWRVINIIPSCVQHTSSIGMLVFRYTKQRCKSIYKGSRLVRRLARLSISSSKL